MLSFTDVLNKLNTARRLPPGERIRVAKAKFPFLQSGPRHQFSWRYLQGQGIEIGALHNPLPLPKGAKVRFVDRMDSAGLRAHYPELANLNLVEVDIVDDGEKLATIENESQNFVIANHFLEHAQNPLLTLENMLRVLKARGILFLTVPDKRFSFDADRPVTSLSHLLHDYQNGPETSISRHYEEWVTLVEKVDNPSARKVRVEQIQKELYSIHFHVWTQMDLLQLIVALPDILGVKIEIEECVRHDIENIIVIRKI